MGKKEARALTFAATSALISSWVSARRFLASSVRLSHSAMNDSRWSTALGGGTREPDCRLYNGCPVAVGCDLHPAQRTGLSPWRQFHNLPEVPGRGSLCTLPGPCAKCKKTPQRLYFILYSIRKLPLRYNISHAREPWSSWAAKWNKGFIQT